jgi:hypothetical protein
MERRASPPVLVDSGNGLGTGESGRLIDYARPKEILLTMALWLLSRS